MRKAPTLFLLLRACAVGIASSGGAFTIVFVSGQVPPKVHAYILGFIATCFAISDGHFKSLLSELAALLRRGTYSVWQLEQLQQTVPPLRKQISFVWSSSTWLKAVVAFACAMLLWDGASYELREISMFVGYSCLIWSVILGCWGRYKFHQIEREVDAVTFTEVQLKEKRRLTKSLAGGPEHDFKSDKLAEGYTKPPVSLG